MSDEDTRLGPEHARPESPVIERHGGSQPTSSEIVRDERTHRHPKASEFYLDQPTSVSNGDDAHGAQAPSCKRTQLRMVGDARLQYQRMLQRQRPQTFVNLGER